MINYFHEKRNMIKEALTELSQILNVKTENDLIAKLIGAEVNGNIDLNNINFLLNDIKLDDLVKYILDMQNGGTFLNEFEANIKSFISGDEGESDLTKKINDKEQRLFTITHESEQENYNFLSTSKISKIIGDGSKYNQQTSSPTKQNPSFGVVQFHSTTLNYANRGAGFASVFLSAVPSTEISKCVPFFDLQIISSANTILKSDRGQSTPNGLSLIKYLSKDVRNDSALDMQRAKRFTTSADLGGKLKSEEVINVAYAGMELFTAPQTMNYVGEKFRDTSFLDKSSERRNILDPKRPFMTVKSFDVNVVPASGMLSSTSATLSLTLHDRSRLSDISELVVPGTLNQVEILIEYGWSHPRKDTPYGKLLNACRVVNKFRVSSTSYNFTPAGEMDITLTMFSKGIDDIAFGLITDDGVKHTMDELTVLLKEIKAIKKKLVKVPSYSQIADSQILGKLNSTNNILTLDNKEIEEVKKIIVKLSNDLKDLQNTDVKSTLKNMTTKLNKALDNTSVLKKDLTTTVNKLLADIRKGDDPFLKDKTYKGAPKKKTHVSFAKLATIFMAKNIAANKNFDEVQLVFYPMNEYSGYCRDDDVGSFPINISKFKKYFSERIKENYTMSIIQFIGFMNSIFFSNLASDAYGFGSIYQRDENGQSKVKSNAKKKNILAEKENVLVEAYGGKGSALKFKKPSIQLVIETVPHINDPNKSICRMHFFDASTTSYSSYYDVYQAALDSNYSTFNREAIDKEHTHIKKGGNSQASARGDHGKVYAQSANDIFQNPLFNNFFKSKQIKVIEKNEAGQNVEKNQEVVYINGGPNKIRSFFTYTMPTLKYGTEASGIINANLSTSTDPTLQAIHMKKQFQKNAHSPDADSDDGMPLKTLRTSLELECYGCPFIIFGQQFFVDFQTNTTADDVYAVKGFSHKIAPGSFSTNVQLVPLQREGQFESILKSTQKLINEIDITNESLE